MSASERNVIVASGAGGGPCFQGFAGVSGILERKTLIDVKCAEASGSSRHSIHKGTNALLFMTENRQFHHFIIITMILTAAHDSAITPGGSGSARGYSAWSDSTSQV